MLEPCSPGDAGAFPATLQSLADQGKAELVQPPAISMRDFEKVLLRARPTVSQDDLKVYEDFTANFGARRGGRSCGAQPLALPLCGGPGLHPRGSAAHTWHRP